MVSISKIKKIFFESLDWSHTVSHSVNSSIITFSIINRMLVVLKCLWNISNIKHSFRSTSPNQSKLLLYTYFKQIIYSMFPNCKNVSKRPSKIDPVCCLTHKWYHHSFIRIKLHRHHTLFLWFFCYCSIPFIDKLTLITTMKTYVFRLLCLTLLLTRRRKIVCVLNKV